ncbi:MAG: ubiquinol-cytochrome c reductase iron-sulfur subunit [bacterium]
MNPAEESVTRRRFLDYVIGGLFLLTGLGVLAPVVSFLRPPRRRTGAAGSERVEVAPLSELQVGAAKAIQYQGKNVLVIHSKRGVTALDMKCTHLGCMIEWLPDKEVVYCPCHGAFFDPQGNVLSGPPPRPQPNFKVEIAGEIIYVTGEA